VFPVRALNTEMVLETKNAFASWMRPGLGSEMTMDPNLVIPPSKLCHCEFKGDVSAAIERLLATMKRDGQEISIICIRENSRLRGRLEVPCEPDS
jgi:hypothetical protein